jgi:transcriptional regulator with XRE-family HTH domain
VNKKANQLKERRKMLAYSTRELATLSTVPEKDIIAYEKDEKTATLKTIEKITSATNTKVSDWVTEDYFRKPKYKDNINENILDKSKEEMFLDLLKAMYRADEVMDLVYEALIEMNEVKFEEDKNVVFSKFGQELCISVSAIKMKKVLSACRKDFGKVNDLTTDEKGHGSGEIYTHKNSTRKKRVIFDDLLRECKVLFKGTDTLEVIIQSLIDINCIDHDGNSSEKADLLLRTIMENKIKGTLKKH